MVVIDIENHSVELYSYLGPYNVLSLSAPYSPERYISAIQMCKQAGMEVVSFFMSFFVYIIYSSSLDCYYVGHTADLADRFVVAEMMIAK